MQKTNEKLAYLIQLSLIEKSKNISSLKISEKVNISDLLLKRESKVFNNKVEFDLYLLKYPANDIIAFDEYDSCLFIRFDTNDKKVIIDNLLSYRTNEYDLALDDYNFKLHKMLNLELNDFLDFIIKKVEK